MKTKKWALTSLAFLIVAIGIASDFPTMNVVPVNNEKALLAYEADYASPLEITLTADDGEILYYKKTTKRYADFKKVFDFSELGKGEYCMCVNFGNRSVNRKVSVQKDGIRVSEPQRLYEPYFCLKDKKLNVSFFNGPCEGVYVNIYRKGQHIQGIKLGKDLTIHKCLALSKLRAGEYEIVLTDKFKEHKYIAQL
jgi:hypothetical protein